MTETEINNLLKSHGLKVTDLRVRFLLFMSKSKTAVPQKNFKYFPELKGDRSTFYRMLNRF